MNEIGIILGRNSNSFLETQKSMFSVIFLHRLNCMHKDLPLEVHGTSNIIVQPLRILDQTVVVESEIGQF